MGVSVENQDVYFTRIDTLRETGAHVKFLSLEPLLGPLADLALDGIDWVIVGGESGPGARPLEAHSVETFATSVLHETFRSSLSNGVAYKKREQDAYLMVGLGMKCR